MLTARKDCRYIFRSRLIFFAKLAISAAILVVLFRQAGLAEFARTFSGGGSPHLLLAAVLVIPNLLVQICKWRYVLRLASPDIDWQTSYRSLLVGFPLGFVTPGRLGEIGRAFYVPQVHQLKTLRLFVFDKTTNLIVVLLCGLLTLLLFKDLDLGLALKIVISLSALGILAVVLYASVMSSKISFVVGKLLRVHTLERKNLAVVLGLSLLFFAIYLGQLLLLVSHFSDYETMSGLAAAISALFAKTLLPIGFADLGIREGAVVFFFAKINVSNAAALNSGLALFLLNVGAPTLFGLPILLKTRRELQP